MSESRDLFIRRTEKSHIQRDELEEFIQQYEEGKVFLGIDKEIYENVINDLSNDKVERSNDMIIEMIINNVLRYTEDFMLKNILENINIAMITDDESIIGKSYAKYYDGSYYIEVGRNIDKSFMFLSELLAVLFMDDKTTNHIEKSLLDGLLNANLQRYNMNEDFNESYNEVQMYMMLWKQVVGNDDFTEKYVACAHEIYETAIAFFVGHEIGHHYYGHTDSNIKNNEGTKNKEICSDNFGIDFAITYLKSSYNNAYNICQFAGMYIPVIVSANYCNDIFEDGKRHPSIAKRFNFIKNKLGETLDKESAQKTHNYISKLCEIIQFGKK